MESLAVVVLLALAGSGCVGGTGAAAARGSASEASEGSGATAAVGQELRARLASAPISTALTRGERLIEPGAVARFYDARKYEPAWPNRAGQEQVVQAIRDIERDGLSPADYHLEAIQTIMSQGEPRSAQPGADLELLLTDAVAGMLDHVRHGRVLPVSLDPGWNVNPREGAPPLEADVAAVAASRSATEAIESAKPRHFIYRGLIGALAQLRGVAERGGWRAIPPGKTLNAHVADPRVPAIRARLAASGELQGAAAADSLRNDSQLHAAIRLFQQRHRLDSTGTVGASTLAAMNVPVADRIAQVRVNLERARWVLQGLNDDFLLVNLPAYKVYLIRGGRSEWESRTQIGKDARRTPTFRSDIRTVVLNPDWTVPPTILAHDVLDGMRKGGDLLAKKKLMVLDAKGNEVDPASIDWKHATPANFPYTLRQAPGEGNALGRVKFLFPNKYSIYLHDTPHKELFASDSRTFSSGCIRLEHAMDLATVLLAGKGDWTAEKIQQVVDEGQTQNVALKPPLPVLIVYWTVSVGASGEIRYMRDAYNLDPAVLAALDSPPSVVAMVTGRSQPRTQRP